MSVILRPSNRGVLRDVLVLLLFACLPALPVHAQVLEEILVTATKREESMQDIPISMAAFSEDTIQQLGFNQSYDIAAHVPNLQFMAEASQSTPFIFLRGIGNTSFFPNGIKPVALYVDQAYVGPSVAQGLQIFDLERVEVLRGPQGTLFGRNATGGLINFITRKPDVDDGYNARVELTAAEYGQIDVEAAGGMPLGESAAVRVALFQQTGSGMYDHVAPGVDDDSYGDVDTLGVRGQILWEPTQNVSMLLSLHYGHDDSDTTAEKPGYIISPFGVPNCPPGAVSGALFNGCSDPFGLGATVDPDFDDVQFTYAPHQDLETYGVLFEVNWDIGDYTFTSLTSWDRADRELLSDDDANVLVILNDTFISDSDWFSQEFRLATNFEGSFNWLVGLNYYTDDLDSRINFAAPHLPPPPGIPFPLGLGQDLQQETRSWAVFGEATWNFHPDWTLRLGLRLTDDEREVAMDSFAFVATAVDFMDLIPAEDARAAFVFPFIPPMEVEDDWFEWSGRAALDWKFADGQLLYASASRGFKGGEFNGGALLHPSEATMADPEFINSYELGYKGSLFEDTVQLNITGFFMEYKDQQILISNATPLGLLPNLQNAGRSDITGFEFDIGWQPTENWYFMLGGGYLNAEFDEFLDPVLGIDRAGNTLPHAPEWNFNGIVRYERPLYNGTAALQLDWWWMDDQFTTVENDPGLFLEDRGLVNMRASYAFWDERVELALFVKNLTDEEFVVTSFDTSQAGFGAYIHVLSQPRVVGGQVILRFP